MDDDAPIPTHPGPTFRRRMVTIPAQATVPFVDGDWHGALVLIERGSVDLCCVRGGRRRFAKGAVLFFDDLGLTALHNPGVEDVVLVALSREVTDK
ncbi:MAG: hypothetical protein H0X35_07800 [Pseudonocardiales bacterium]|nr:hypothetical protein [Pseudonocardiales bacterium]